MTREKAQRIADALMWLPLQEADNDGLEDILTPEQDEMLRARLREALLNPDTYDMPIVKYPS